MKLYLDDIRSCPDNLILCKNAESAIALIKSGYVTYISLDHDLGEELTGYDVAKEIEYLCYKGIIDCPNWYVHSSNPVGRKRIRQAMIQAFEFSKQRRFSNENNN